MRARDVYKMLAGSFMIYVAFAACSASKPGGSNPTSHGDGGAGVTDPVPNAKADPASGSRLKAKFRLADDGSKEYLSGVWYDSERQEDCSFANASDGKQHCMPTSQATVTFFADASCSQPLAVGSSSCAPKYAVTFEPSACSAGTVHIYAIGAAATPAKLYVSANGTCIQAGTPDPASTYYQVGAEVPASSFVGGAEQHDK